MANKYRCLHELNCGDGGGMETLPLEVPLLMEVIAIS